MFAAVTVRNVTSALGRSKGGGLKPSVIGTAICDNSSPEDGGSSLRIRQARCVTALTYSQRLLAFVSSPAGCCCWPTIAALNGLLSPATTQQLPRFLG